MLILIILLGLALAVFAVAYYLFTGLPDSRTRHAGAFKGTFAAGMVIVHVALGLVIQVKRQEASGAALVVSGGVQSDARQWIQAQSPTAPVQSQAGDNIRIYREGLMFLRSHDAVASKPEVQSLIQKYSTLPERPTKLLSRDEEIAYYEASTAVWEIISNLAK